MSSFWGALQFIIEAVTGTMWNSGLIAGYSMDAGGRTVNPDSTKSSEGFTIMNVRSNSSRQEVGGLGLPILEKGTSLEKWAIERIIVGPGFNS